MTAADFQRSPDLRADLRTLLDNPVFKLAKSIGLAQFMAKDVEVDAPDIASVRYLSRRGAYEGAYKDLEDLTIIPPEPTQQPKVDWGAPDAVDHLNLEDLPPPFTHG